MTSWYTKCNERLHIPCKGRLTSKLDPLNPAFRDNLRSSKMTWFDLQGAPIKGIPYNLLLITHQWFKLIFLIFCRSIERLYQHILAKLYFAMSNNEKDTVN